MRSLLLIFLAACAPMPAETPPVRRVEVSEVPRPPSPSATPTNAPPRSGVVAERPTFAMLAAFAAGQQPAVVDEKRGVVRIVVGPQTSGAGGNDPPDLDDAERLCGAAATTRTRSEITRFFEYHTGQDFDEMMPCAPLACVKLAQGEWDDETRFEFARTSDGRLVLDRIVKVLDVPMRIGVEEDFAKAKAHSAALDQTRCP